MSKTEVGPVYGVELISFLPMPGTACGMNQAMPSRHDLEAVRKVSERVVAGYEVLLEHYRYGRDRMIMIERAWQADYAAQEMRHKDDIVALTGILEIALDNAEDIAAGRMTYTGDDIRKRLEQFRQQHGIN